MAQESSDPEDDGSPDDSASDVPTPAPSPAASGEGRDERRRSMAYWRANLRWLAILLSIWFLVSFGCGILFVEPLNEIRVGGFRLGFWFAQQGSIYVFVVLIAIYVRVMNRLDRKYGASDE
jgi:putative solute:sodium symporter small subunit